MSRETSMTHKKKTDNPVENVEFSTSTRMLNFTITLVAII